jgi:hypothetical protein
MEGRRWQNEGEYKAEDHEPDMSTMAITLLLPATALTWFEALTSAEAVAEKVVAVLITRSCQVIRDRPTAW